MCEYRILEIVIQVLVALGTCGAVGVSLWLASSQKKLNISISLSIMRMFGEKNPYLQDDIVGKDFVVLSIHNHGTRPAILQSTNFTIDFKRKDNQMVLAIPSDMLISPYPRTLGWGESTAVALNKYEEFLEHIVSDEKNYKNLHKFEVYYFAGTGEKVRAKIHKRVRQDIIKAAKELKEKKGQAL